MIDIGTRVVVTQERCSWHGYSGLVTSGATHGWWVQLPGEPKPLLFGWREVRELDLPEPHWVAGD